MVIHYKCPNCGDDMGFDSETGTLSCQSCGRQDHIDSFPDQHITTTFSEDEAKQYHCNNCGAVILADVDTVATHCNFCGAGVVLSDRISGTLAPAKVIPFTISKEKAKKAFRNWCKNGKLTPNKFMEANRIKGITGMYVPFWLYDLNSQVEVKATCTKKREYTRGDYIYKEIKYYDVYRKINLDYKKVPVDASEKMNDDIMDKLEPFHYEDLKDFKTPYLAGYIAEKYNYNDQQLFPRVKSRVKNFIDSYVRSTMKGYTTIEYQSNKIQTKNQHSEYVLFPVWMFYYDYDQSEHTFAMNGQTGKIVGKPPISYAKVAGWFTGIAATTFITLKILAFLMGGGLW
ncbi:DNA-directed RNA polymerase subunit RPC12/RpoP [Oikeobacillus pervagus]|uniref:DNA-directed RNA polymerase subunit RPC12/RpoP n=1 Tax=Oikeobacillus pervagus TaxID=1325931 RepID=A0AAJ1T359_9BACI|nr:TFIIB-type zinc ribbon-containing protein [Oikeobacillus pervagus]MDQ0214010.1 DNA-directed RNA polymerase subunit RPC12/RpoP [Oikeobacillus pervagus]